MRSGMGIMRSRMRMRWWLNSNTVKIPFLQQPRFPIIYREKQVSEFVPDLIAFDKIIVDTKVIERITDHEIGQMLNYLKVTGLPVGLILNFKNSKLEFRRVVASTQNFIRRKQP